jgi:hypothetical protein
MTWSSKAADLQRDPRYVLHSAVTGPDSGEREIKLYGSAVEAGQDLRGTTAGAWWSAWPPGKAIVFSLGIEQAVFIGWDTGHGLMTVHRWSPRSGSSQSSRARRCGSFGQGWVECVFAGNAGRQRVHDRDQRRTRLRCPGVVAVCRD